MPETKPASETKPARSLTAIAGLVAIATLVSKVFGLMHPVAFVATFEIAQFSPAVLRSNYAIVRLNQTGQQLKAGQRDNRGFCQT